MSNQKSMMRLSPCLRFLVGVTARLAVMVIAVQLAALDHHFSVQDVVGVEGSSAHALHCHGDTQGCAGDASGAVMAVEGYFVLPRQVLAPVAIPAEALRGTATAPSVEPQPPRLWSPA
jgi:hypothetical protein